MGRKQQPPNGWGESSNTIYLVEEVELFNGDSVDLVEHLDAGDIDTTISVEVWVKYELSRACRNNTYRLPSTTSMKSSMVASGWWIVTAQLFILYSERTALIS